MTAFQVHPRDLSDVMVAAVATGQTNIVALEPAEPRWALTFKQGTATVRVLDIEPDVGAAAVIRLAAAAHIDLLDLTSNLVDGIASRRVRVRIERADTEVLISVLLRADGLGAEIRPLSSGRSVVLGAALARCTACGALHPRAAPRCVDCGGAVEPVHDRVAPGGFVGVYALAGEIGRGAMGQVFSAEHALLKQEVVVKVLHRSVAASPLVGRRFLAEARAVATLRHPGIVTVHDYGVLGDGRAFMVMERVEGRPLSDLGTLRPIHALQVARACALALSAAHQRGIVHLDVKPANVIVLDAKTSEEQSGDGPAAIKLIDFGAAARIGVAATAGDLVGTPAYMAPEHARGEPVDARTDVYALGVMLFELLAGRVPFDFSDPWRTFSAHMFQPPPTVTSPGGPLPEIVRRAVARALAKKPSERYQSATEMVTDLDAAIAAIRAPWTRWLW